MSARLAALRYCFAMVLVYVVIASASRRGVYADESSLTPCHCTVGAGCINNTCYIDDSEPREQCLVSFLYEPPRYACLKESILHATRCVEISPGQLTRCCRRVAFCNVDFSGPVPTEPALLVTTADPETTTASSALSTATVASISAVAFCILIICLLLMVCIRRRQKHWEELRAGRVVHGPLEEGPWAEDGCAGIGDGGSSSGRGPLVLDARTLSREFESRTKVSTGRYGDILRARWRSRFVSIKTFKLKDEEAFKWEKGLYLSFGLNHNHLLEFIAADTQDCQLETQQWLVTAHHDNGTLLRFLRAAHPSYDFILACQLARSIASGLAYLHSSIAGAARAKSSAAAAAAAGSEMMGMGNKPSIAHCALSSDVILIKSDMTCCLSDLTMATQLATDSKTILNTAPVLSKAAAHRYMAPELLLDTINTGLFESYRQLDMYAFALLLWEIIWCCPMLPNRLAHRMPFEGIVAPFASVGDWAHVVGTMHVRPPVCSEWKENKAVARYDNLMKSCWNSRANGRRTALNATKTLHACLEEFHKDWNAPPSPAGTAAAAAAAAAAPLPNGHVTDADRPVQAPQGVTNDLVDRAICQAPNNVAGNAASVSDAGQPSRSTVENTDTSSPPGDHSAEANTSDNSPAISGESPYDVTEDALSCASTSSETSL